MHIHGHSSLSGQFFLLVEAEGLADKVAEAPVRPALEGELIAVVLGEHIDVAGGGAEHPQGQVGLLRGLTAQQRRKAGGGPGHLDLLRPGEAHDAEAAEGRVKS